MLTEAGPPPYYESVVQNQSVRDCRHQPVFPTGRNSYNDQFCLDGRETPSLPATNKDLDLTQRLERKLAEYNASANPFKRWLFEILCWCISAICMGAIVAIYARIKNRPMADTKLLAYANALGKVASAALIVPTSEALGQLKWNWFSKSRAMWDFEIFDKASRGPMGAILLLFRTKGRSLAALGAILIVMLLAIDTFFQQVVDLPGRLTLQEISGTLPRAGIYKPLFTPAYWAGYESTSEDRAISAIGREFLYRNGTQPVPFGNGTRPDVPLTCPSSDCAWPLYETLAVCSSCTDVSDIVQFEYACLNTTIEWSTTWYEPRKVPNPTGTVCGYFINSTSDNPLLLSGYVQSTNDSSRVGEALITRAIPLTHFDDKSPYYGDGSIAFDDVRWPILDALISSVKNGTQSVYQDEPPVITECMLTWCIATMKSSYAAGQYEEEVLSTYLEPKKPTDPWPWTSIPIEDSSPFLIYEQNLTLAPPFPRTHDLPPGTFNEAYHIDNQTQANVMCFFDDFFPSFYTAANALAVPSLRFRNYEVGSFVQELPFNPWQYPNNLTQHMERLATAMTNVVRSSVSRTMLEGEAFQIESYISVRWEWLTFPFILLLLSLVFLVLTIMRTSGDGEAAGVWKTSAMPTLIYSLPKENQDLFASSTWGSGQEAHKKTRIKLLPHLGWRISGQNQLINQSPRLPSGERVPRGWI